MTGERVLEPYRAVLDRWFPAAHLRAPGARRGPLAVTWRAPIGKVDYIVHLIPHLATRDAPLVAAHLRATLVPRGRHGARGRLLLLAPYVRPQQAEVLRQQDIDYLDLAGNAHLDAPGLHVHVEGKRLPPPAAPAGPGRVTNGWVRVVLALLVDPELVVEPYRVTAVRAGVALGALVRLHRDLRGRGFLRGIGPRAKLVRREELLTLWVQAYTTILRPTLAERRFALPRETKHEMWKQLRGALTHAGAPWTLTGGDAAYLVDRFLETDVTQIYVDTNALTVPVLRELKAQPTLTEGSLIAIEPPGPVALAPTAIDGWPCAPLLLTYAELQYAGTEQAREAADRLMPRLLESVA